MGTTPTTNYNLLKPIPFEEEDTWGPILNTNWDKVDTQMKANADGVAAVSSALAGKQPLDAGLTKLAALSGNGAVVMIGDEYTLDGTVYAKVGATNAFTASQVIDVTDDANPALRITQKGTGPVLRVEDSVSPDATPFIIDADGKVGISMTPTYNFDCAGSMRKYMPQANAYNVMVFENEGGGAVQIGVNGQQGELRTVMNGPLVLSTNNAPRATIAADGNVGIGAAPITSQGRFQVWNTGITGGAPASSGMADPNQLTAFVAGGVQLRSGVYASGVYWLQASLTSDYGGNLGIAINPNGGNVGIGVTPANKFHVQEVVDGNVVVGRFANVKNASVATASSVDITADQAIVRLTSQRDALGNSATFIISQGVAGAVTERFRIDTAGLITSLPTYNTTGAGNQVNVDSAGVFRRAASSIKYKKDVEPLEHDLVDNAVSKLRPVWFRSKNPSGDDSDQWSHIGLIAEEVAQVEPRLVAFRTMDVVEVEQRSVDDEGNETVDKKTVAVPRAVPEPENVHYDRLSVILLDKVQRMITHIEALEARIATLEGAAK